MKILTALLTLSAAAGVVVGAKITCPNPIYCPCGRTGKNITICQETESRENEPCRKWSRCNECEEGRNECLQCEDGYEGPFCEKFTPEIMCPDPVQVPNADRMSSDGSLRRSIIQYRIQNSVVYTCHQSFAFQSGSVIRCLFSGEWSCALVMPQSSPQITTVSSQEVMCPDPGQVSNAKQVNSDGRSSGGVQQYRVGQSVVYICHPGFVLQGRGFISCLASGEWSSRTPYCTSDTLSSLPNPTIGTARENLRFCRDIGVDPNGSRLPSMTPTQHGFPEGSRIEFKCNPGHDLWGDSNIYCLSYGAWSANRPKCIAQTPDPDTSDDPLVYCFHPGTVPNGRFTFYPGMNGKKRKKPPEYPVFSGLQYSCKNGYVLEGRSLLVCEESGLWSGNPPSCKRAMKSVEP